MMLYQHAVLVVSKDVQTCSGMVLVCIMITNPSSSTGSQCENSISLVFVDIRAEVIYFERKQRPSASFRLFIDDDDDDDDDDDKLV